MTFGAVGVGREAVEALAVSAIAVTGLGDRSLGRRRFLLWPSYLRSCGLGSARAWGFGHWPGVRGVWIELFDLRQAPVSGVCLAFALVGIRSKTCLSRVSQMPTGDYPSGVDAAALSSEPPIGFAGVRGYARALCAAGPTTVSFSALCTRLPASS